MNFRIGNRPGASFTKQLSMNLGLSFSLSEKFTLIPFHKISKNLKLKAKIFHETGPWITVSSILTGVL